ncbi:MAG: DUF72 domain-containing protein [Candidatus Aureabacteria bacterium]|nr:DUF72 domain-containing protein [Candidatus Auribacterota bacterium]
MKKMFFGTAGWSYPDWKGKVYPLQAPDNFDRLRYLSDFVDFIEINSSFYSYPSVMNANSWSNSVKDKSGFVFSAKLHRDFTHNINFPAEGSVSAVKRFLDALKNNGNFACLLAQFPYSFHFTKENRSRAGKIFKAFRGYNVVTEIRHSSWNCGEAESFLYENSSGIATIDQPERSLNIKPKFHDGSRILYLRLHGRNRESWFNEKSGRDERYDYLYSEAELRPFADGLSHPGILRGYAVGNNHYEGKAFANILQLKSMFLKSKTKCPPVMLENYEMLTRYCYADTPVQKKLL